VKKAIAAALVAALFSGCAGTPQQEAKEEKPKSHRTKILGATAGGGIGAYVAYSSTACAIGGPLCAVVVIPAVIFGGLIGGTAGAIGDATRDALASEPSPSRADTSARPDG
jgi:hypothetical protein